MAITTLRLADLEGLTEEQQAARIAEFSAGRFAPLNGEVADLDSQIARFETRYEMSSATMRKKFSNGEIEETADICAWTMLLNLRDKLAPKTC